jgi:hypothetical protein
MASEFVSIGQNVVRGINSLGAAIKAWFSAPMLFAPLILNEITTPGNAPANSAKLFARDNGGKTELCVIFPSGLVIQIAIEV